VTARRVCSSRDLVDGEATRVEVDGTPVAIVRLDGRVYAIGDVCSHAEVSLSDGDVDPDECALECPKHGSLFSLETGAALTLPAIRPVSAYEVTLDGDDVLIGSAREPEVSTHE
jgi:3-phenylpropionate/trans-cinnamate dioxygenase ferredoxin subunit